MSNEQSDLSASVNDKTFIGLSDQELKDILDLRMGSIYHRYDEVLKLPEVLTPFQQEMVNAGRASELFVGGYLLVSQIGSGGMGVVYRAEHLSMGRTVALKVLSPELLKSKLAVSRFLREVRAVAKLHHPNIVTAFDARMTDDEHYLAMELVEGSDLDRIVQTQGPFSIPEAAEIILQVALALACVHDQGMVHRDIKPSNLMLDHSGQIKVMDFGLTKLGFTETDDSSSDLTNPGTIIGSIDYLAPEQARDFRIASPAADIYSLGCTLGYLLTGGVPFHRSSIIETLTAHQSARVDPIIRQRPDVPKQLNHLYMQMLAKDPAKRPASMYEVAERIREFTAPSPPMWFLKRKLPETHDSTSNASLETASLDPLKTEIEEVNRVGAILSRRLTHPPEASVPPQQSWIPQLSTRDWLLAASILTACFALWCS